MHKWKKKREEETTFCTQLKKKITEKKLLFFFLSLLAPRCAKVLCITSRKSKKERKARCLFSLEAFKRRRAKSRSVLWFQFSFVRVLLVQKFGSRPPKGKSYYFLRGDVFSAPRFHHVLLSARRHMLFFCQFFFFHVSWRRSLCTPRRFGIRFFVFPQMSEEVFG